MSRRLKILIGGGIVLGLVILVPVIHHYQLRFAVEKYISELKAKGEPMDLAQVVPPPVPPEKDGADIFRGAAAFINADKSLNYSNYISGMKMVVPGRAMIRWQQPDIRDSDATNTWEDVEAALAQNGKSFELLQEIIGKPDFDFQLNYEHGFVDFAFTNLFLSESKRAALRLETAALCDLHRGDTASAAKKLRAMLALANAIRNERLAISELVRIAIAQIALTVNWELLQSPNLTDEQLAEIQNDWAHLDFIQSEIDALNMERAAGEITTARWRSSNFELQHYLDAGKRVRESMGHPDDKETVWDKTKMAVRVYMWRNWWSYSDELRCQKGFEVLLNTARLAKTNGAFGSALQKQTSQLNDLGISKLADEWDLLSFGQTDLHSMLSESVVSLSGVTKRVMNVEVTKQMAITATALKRYQFKHGTYPPDLNSLVPEFVSAIPLDPVDGQPLHYRRNADGSFLLYSIGEDGKDDSGDPQLPEGSKSMVWQRGHDWVWPQSATPEEIRNFYEHPPK